MLTCQPPLHPCSATSTLRPLIFTTASFLFWNPFVQKFLLGLHVAPWPVPMEPVCASCLSRTWFRFRVNRVQRCCPEHAFVFGSMPWFVPPRKNYPALVTIRHLFATRNSHLRNWCFVLNFHIESIFCVYASACCYNQVGISLPLHLCISVS